MVTTESPGRSPNSAWTLRAISLTQSSTNRGFLCAERTTCPSSPRLSSSNIGVLMEFLRIMIIFSSCTWLSSSVSIERVPLPRWLWVAMGTSLKNASIFSFSTERCSRTSRARSFMIFWAQGHAVIPVTSAPMLFLTIGSLKVRWAIALAKTFTTSWQRVPVTGVSPATMNSDRICTSVRSAYSCLSRSLRATRLHSCSISLTSPSIADWRTSSITSKLRERLAPFRLPGRSTKISKLEIKMTGRFPGLVTSTSFFTFFTPTLVRLILTSGRVDCTSGSSREKALSDVFNRDIAPSEKNIEWFQ